MKLIKLWLLFYSVWVLVTDPSAQPTVWVLVTDPSAKPTGGDCMDRFDLIEVTTWTGLTLVESKLYESVHSHIVSFVRMYSLT